MKGKIRIGIVGVGGQGIIRAARIIADAAIQCGLEALMNEVHGMSQRGGIVETSLVLGPASSAMIGRGKADVMVAFEPLEAIRSMRMVSEESLVIINSHPIVPPGCHRSGGRYIGLETKIESIRRRCRELVVLEAFAIACRIGSPRSMTMVMFGALAGSRVLPFAADVLHETMRTSVGERFFEVNKKAFAMGHKAYEASRVSQS